MTGDPSGPPAPPPPDDSSPGTAAPDSSATTQDPSPPPAAEPEAPDPSPAPDAPPNHPAAPGAPATAPPPDPPAGAAPKRRKPGRSAIIAAVAGLALVLGFFALYALDPPGEPALPVPTTAQPPTSDPSTVVHSTLQGFLPDLTFDLSTASFDPPFQQADDTYPPAELTLTVVHRAGSRDTLVTFDRPVITPDPGITAPVPVLSPTRSDCFDRPRAAGANETYCAFVLEWRPSEPASFAGTLTLAYQQHIPAGTGQRDPAPEHSSATIRVVADTQERPPPPTVTYDPPELDFGMDVPPGQPRTLYTELAVSDHPVHAFEHELRNTPGIRLDNPENCQRNLQPGADSNRDFCALSVTWTPQPAQNLAGSVILHWETTRGPPGSHPDRHTTALPVRGTAATTLPALHAQPPEAVAPLAAAHATVTLTASVLPAILNPPTFTGSQPPPALDSDCPPTLAPGTSCALTVRWTVPALTPQSAVIEQSYIMAGDTRTLAIPVHRIADPTARPAPVDPTELQLRLLRSQYAAGLTQPVLQPGIGILSSASATASPHPGPPSTTEAATTPPSTAGDPPPPGPPSPVPDTYRDAGIPTRVSTQPVDLRYVIQSHTRIRALVTQTVMAKLPTPITAAVQADLYDPSGRHLLLPRGTKILGTTRATDAAGPATSGAYAHMLTTRAGRLIVDWSIIRRPDGVSFPVSGALATQDTSGNPGIPGHIDHRDFERYLFEFLGAGTDIALILALDASQQTTTTTTPNPITGAPTTSTTVTQTPDQQARQRFAEAIQTVASDLARLQVPPPTLTVPAGTPIALIPTADLWLAPLTAPSALAPPPPARQPFQIQTATPPPPAPSVPATAGSTPAASATGTPAAPASAQSAEQLPWYVEPATSAPVAPDPSAP